MVESDHFPLHVGTTYILSLRRDASEAPLFAQPSLFRTHVPKPLAQREVRDRSNRVRQQEYRVHFCSDSIGVQFAKEGEGNLLKAGSELRVRITPEAAGDCVLVCVVAPREQERQPARPKDSKPPSKRVSDVTTGGCFRF